jgi:hypothetical protein
MPKLQITRGFATRDIFTWLKQLILFLFVGFTNISDFDFDSDICLAQND